MHAELHSYLGRCGVALANSGGGGPPACREMCPALQYSKAGGEQAQCGEGDWELELELWRGEFDSAGAAL